MKKINVDYKDSYVKTTKFFANTILLVGIIVSCIVVMNGKEQQAGGFLLAVYIILSSFIVFIALMSLSKILQHLLCIRAFNEAKAIEDGYTCTESCCTVTDSILGSAEKYFV